MKQCLFPQEESNFMNIIIHRGQNQIGGSIIEIASKTTKIILDAGSELDEEIPVAPQIEGLFFGQASYDAVFISHYHGDHLGLCDQVLPEIPIYIGKRAADVTNAAKRYLNKPEYHFTSHYESGKTISIGDFQITPYQCYHSAFDAYMFHIACGDKALIYSGDFRSNGRKSFSHLLHRLPQADVLIIEGTTLSRAPVPPKTDGFRAIMRKSLKLAHLYSFYKLPLILIALLPYSRQRAEATAFYYRICIWLRLPLQPEKTFPIL